MPVEDAADETANTNFNRICSLSRANSHLLGQVVRRLYESPLLTNTTPCRRILEGAACGAGGGLEYTGGAVTVHCLSVAVDFSQVAEKHYGNASTCDASSGTFSLDCGW